MSRSAGAGPGSLSRVFIVGVSLVALFTVTACGIFGRSSSRGDDRFVRSGAPRTSPSGSYVASVVAGPAQDGVATTVVVIKDSGGTEVFRDDYAYSNRHGVGVTWLTGQDQLWILSSDVGSAHVDKGLNGWVKTMITPDTLGSVPEEISHLQ